MIRTTLYALAAVAFMPTNARAAVFETECFSPSGKSTYKVRLDTVSAIGTIRYRFMGQDVTYQARVKRVVKGVVSGTASFQSSHTGETRGNPFEFVYNVPKGTFSDGDVIANCS